MVKAIILVKSPKKLIAAKLSRLENVYDSFAISGQFDAVALIEVNSLPEIKEITQKIQGLTGVERTETLIQVETGSIEGTADTK